MTPQSELVIRFSTPAELSAQISAMHIALSSGKDPAAAVADTPNPPVVTQGEKPALSEAEAARIAGGAATVSMPKADGRSAAAKKAKAEAEAKAAEEAAALASTGEAEVDEDPLGEAEVDPLGEAAAESFTKDDVTKMLLELKAAVPADAGLVARVVKETTGVARLGDVTADKYPAIVARVRAEMKKAGK